MTHVALVPLGELMAVKTGSVDPSKFQDEAFDLYSIPAFDRGAPEVADGSAIGSAKQIVESQDVLLSKIVPHIRRTWVVGEDRGRRLIASGEWIVFRSPRVEPGYLRQVLRSDPFHVQFMQTVAGVGGSLLRARPTQVARISIPLPPLSEQRRIAAILNEADSLRAKRLEVLAQLNSLAQSIFIEMFGDEVTNSKALAKRRLGDLIQVKSGDFLPASAMSSEGKIPVFGGNGVNGFHNVSMFERPKIVIGRVGAYCGCVHTTPNKSWVTDNALYVSRVDESLQFEYLAFALQRANLNRVASQSGQPLVSASRIYPVEILVPTIDGQQTFATRIQVVESLQATHRAALAELNALFVSLQHRAFAGQLL